MRDMTYQIDIRCEPGYLHVQAWGHRSSGNLVSIVKDYFKANEEHAYKKILVDMRSMTGKLSAFDAYRFGNTAAENAEEIDAGVKTAIVDLEENRKRFDFLEDASVNRGFNLRFFSKTTDAELWLRKSK
jgi:hypothetical protein